MSGEVGLRRLRFANLHEKSNGVGGAIYLSPQSTLTAIDCTFEHGAARSGGAIYVDQATLTISDSGFVSNSGPEGGGAIFSISGTVTISSSSFTSNSVASIGHSGGNRNGGAIYATGALIISSTSFDSNIAISDETCCAGKGRAVFYGQGYTNEEANAAFGVVAGR